MDTPTQRRVDPSVVRTRVADEGFFTLPQAARLGRVPRSTLYNWIRMGVVTPSRRIVDVEDRVEAEGFSLGDVGYIHLLRHLTRRDVPLEDAVTVLHHLMARFGPPGEAWREASLSVEPARRTRSGRRRPPKVFATMPNEWLTTLAVPGKEGAGQRAALEELGDILPNPITLEAILIPERYLADVEIDPRKAGGMPVARGTGVRADVIRSLLDRVPMSVFLVEYYPHVGQRKASMCHEFDKELDRAA